MPSNCRAPLASVRRSILLSLAVAAALVFAASGATAETVKIEAFDRETGRPLEEFRFLVNEDIAHDDASTTHMRSYSPIVAQGDQDSAKVKLPPGNYLVSVLGGPFPAVPGGDGRDCEIDDPCGYKLAGKPFRVKDGKKKVVKVHAVPNPLPLATLQVRAFHDNFEVNNEDDIPLEEGLKRFHVTVSDPTGEVSVDFFGDPLCGGLCLTDGDGRLTIPNLPPLKYEVEVIPPDGKGWIQTSTIEGTHAFDVWLEEGSDGLSTEEGFTQAAAWFGFVRECSFGDPDDDCPSNDVAGTNTITGRIRQIVDVEAPGQIRLGGTVPEPYVALNNIGGNDEQVWTGRGNPDGTFSIPDVPPGLYQIVYWDFFQDYIIQFRTVLVPDGASGATIDVGDLGMPRWFGQIVGYIYTDLNGNGIRDCASDDPHDVANCEPGIPGEEVGVRHKDGTVVYATVTDDNGFYTIPEYFEWEHFLIWEVGYGRGEQMGTAAYRTEQDGLGAGLPLGYPNDPVHRAGGLSDPAFGPAALLLAQITPAGYTTWIDSGKRPWDTGENGGIAGIVYYAVTRNEFDPSLAAAEDYEPGIPNVVINLFEAVLNSDGEPRKASDGSYRKGALVNTVATDAWTPPTDCDVPEFLGQPAFTDPDCLELPRAFSQVKDGVFDGGYAFEESCLDPSGRAVSNPNGDRDDDGVPNRFDPDLLLNADAGLCSPLPAGPYIVEVVPPLGYRHIREEDQNTDEGDFFVPAVPPPPCAGPLHLVDDPRNPADGTETPLCDAKFVDLKDGFNAEAEFFLMTENAISPPGLLRGVLLDDNIVEFNRDLGTFGEKRGIPNTPIGILDFQGNEITRVYSDEQGYWEALLPSTYTAHCPTPGGICPGMYQVIGNYPGNPLDPDPRWNPNYGALRLVFDVWPASWTFADVAILPITGFVQDPNSLFISPPVCELALDRPDFHYLDEATPPVGEPGDDFTIIGAGFGSTEGTVTLDGIPIRIRDWSDDSITVRVPGSHPVGPQQLVITAANGQASTNGITLHITGPGYDPNVIDVFPGDGTPLQDALDASRNGDLILVHPGAYFESIIVSRNVKLQGFGPGPVGGTLIDGRFFNFGGLTPDEFNDRVADIDPLGPLPICATPGCLSQAPMGQVVTVLARGRNQHGDGFNTQIDGFAIRGGTRLRGNQVDASQGGGIYAHAFIRHLEVSNNLIQSNGGNAGGGVILGIPFVVNPDAGDLPDNQNDFARIHHNRVLNNGGVRSAGAIALFNGAEDYEVAHNVVCGNYSAEYGGGISHFGLSPRGHIHDNEILFNYAFDEGGGAMIGGEQARNPEQVSAGSGEALIERNLVQFNVSNDDGGGIRLLQPVEGPVTIQNNMVANNIATDHGGGISLDDALDVRIVNNTIARNVSTSTAEDVPFDDDTPSPPPAPQVTLPQGAGLSSEPHSQALTEAFGLVPGGFSDPALFNNVFWENEAFFLDGQGNLPSAGFFDLDVVASDAQMSPHASILTDPTQEQGFGTANAFDDPLLVEPVTTEFDVVVFANDPRFITVVIVTSPDDPQGDYHVLDGSPAVDMGAFGLGPIAAPTDDFDGQTRPMGSCIDIGADETGIDAAPPDGCVVLADPDLASVAE